MDTSTSSQPSTNDEQLDQYLEKVKITLQDELRDLTKKAVEYKMKIDSAKTFAKKRYYEKKIKKNNEMAFKVLATLKDL